MIDIFDHVGKRRTDFTEAEIATCPPEKLGPLAEFVDTARAEVADAAAIVEAQDHLKNLMVVRDEKIAAKNKDHPPQTFMSLWRKDIKRETPGGTGTSRSGESVALGPPGTGSDARSVAEHDEIIGAVEREIDEARAAIRSAQHKHSLSVKAAEAATKKWLAQFPVRSPLAVHRENVERGQQRKLALVAQGLPADYQKEQPPAPSVIDQLARGGIGGDINRKYGQGFRRGAAQVAMRGQKVPSER